MSPPTQRDATFPRFLIPATATALFLLLFPYTLSQPYHLDTTAYFASVNAVRSGHFTCGYQGRCMVSYVLAPFAILGADAVKIGLIVAAVAFFVFSSLFFARIFSHSSAYVASLMTTLTPAGLVTITHLKEDFVGLMFLALALFLASDPGPRIGWKLLSPVAFSFSLLSKEVFLVFAPFYFLIFGYYLFASDADRAVHPASLKNKLLLLGASTGIAVGLTLLLDPGYARQLAALTQSPHLGQFKGPFSSLLPSGIRLFERGMGFSWLFWFQFLGLVLPVTERDGRRRLLYGVLVLNGIAIALVSMNNTVMTYRNFLVVSFVTMPMAVFALERLLANVATAQIVRITIYAAGAVTVLGLVTRTYAYIDFHARYNPQERFFAGLRSRIDAKAILVTMDYGGLARYYLGAKTRQYVPGADDEQAERFVKEIEQDGTGVYYLLPDAFAYDSRHTIATRMRQAFRMEQTYVEWFEDYHRMDFGYSPDELRARFVAQSGCTVEYRVTDGVSLGAITLDAYRYELSCGGRVKRIESMGYRGKVFPDLGRAPVSRLLRRE